MASTFAWLDYSEHERRKMLDVIELFGERTTRDELGIGGVRDAFADMLFPGTSTIQTAAKYFLFVPWIYLSLEEKRIPSSKIAERARKLEILLAQELESSGETEGVIGRFAKERRIHATKARYEIVSSRCGETLTMPRAQKREPLNQKCD